MGAFLGISQTKTGSCGVWGLVALLLCTTKVLLLKLCAEYAFSPLSWYSVFLPQLKNMYVRLGGDSELHFSVSGVGACVVIRSVCLCGGLGWTSNLSSVYPGSRQKLLESDISDPSRIKTDMSTQNGWKDV